MRPSDVIFPFLVFILLATGFARANDAPPPATSGSTAAGIGRAAEPHFSGKQDEEWKKIQTELGVLKTKLDAEQAIVNELLLQKKNNKGSISNDQVNQLNTHDKTLAGLANEYKTKLSEFELKYPEKGQDLGRKYIRKGAPEALDGNESLTLEDRVKKVNKKIQHQYGELNKPKKVESRKKTSVENTSQTIPPRKDPVTEKIIIVK